MSSFQMFVLDVPAYLLLKSGKMETEPAFSRNYALKEALAIIGHPGHTTFDICLQKIAVFPKPYGIESPERKLLSVARGYVQQRDDTELVVA